MKMNLFLITSWNQNLVGTVSGKKSNERFLGSEILAVLSDRIIKTTVVRAVFKKGDDNTV